MKLVLDGSAALAWCFKDEKTPTTEHLLDTVIHHGALVPGVWRLEVLNGMRSGMRRGRITQTERDENLQDLLQLNIETDRETDLHAWSATLRLADRFGLTPYDASYLELAHRTNRSLATLDSALQQAAIDLGVAIYPL